MKKAFWIGSVVFLGLLLVAGFAQAQWPPSPPTPPPPTPAPPVAPTPTPPVPVSSPPTPTSTPSTSTVAPAVENPVDLAQTLRSQLERELVTAERVNDITKKNLEVAGVLAGAALKEAEAGRLDEAQRLASQSLDLTVKVALAHREAATTIQKYAEAIKDLAEAVK